MLDFHVELEFVALEASLGGFGDGRASHSG